MVKNNLKQKLNKAKVVIATGMAVLHSKVYAAEGSISTAEVNQATENIKNAVMKLAMPIRRNISIC